MKYRLSKKAILDLEEIWLYTFETWSAEQADKYHILIFEEIQNIVFHFDDGRNMNSIKPGYRVSKVKSHLIFYKKEDNFTIEIVRILHQMMDIPKNLK